MCHHPDLATDPERYFSQPTAWMEDGVGINPTLSGSLFTAETASDLTRSTLNITITVDYFRNKSFNYSCLLVLAENGLPSGSQISVNKATVDPVGEWAVYNMCMQLELIIQMIICKYTHMYVPNPLPK